MGKNRENASRQSTKAIPISLKRLEASLGVQARHSVALTPAQRRAIQASPLSYRKLAGHLDVNLKTIEKWKHRKTPYDQRRGPRGGKSKSLTEREEQEIVYHYVVSGKSIDECLKDVSKRFPLLTRSSYYRCIKRIRNTNRPLFAQFILRSAASQLKIPGAPRLHPSTFMTGDPRLG